MGSWTIFVIGPSTAGKLVQHMISDLIIKDAYNKFTAQLTNVKVTTRITYLEGLWLKKNDNGILDLNCNFAPIVTQGLDRVPFTSRGRGGSKKFHLCDLEG